MNALGVDPHNLKFDFERDWCAFRDAKVKRFLALYLRKRIYAHRLNLESAAPEKLGEVQGQIREAKQLLAVIEQAFITEQLTEVLKFLETDYGK
jgi:hypothetical protein